MYKPLLQVVGFNAWNTKYRPIATDMAGFAINTHVLFAYPKLMFNLRATVGYQESDFLEQCCTIQDLEPKADNCTKVYILSLWYLTLQNLELKFILQIFWK